MAAKVSLREIVQELDCQHQGCESFLDPETGKIVMITEEERWLLESEELDGLPDWQKELIPQIREVMESDRPVRLPTSFDIHEWSIMEGFCSSVQESSARGELLDAIHRRGAFRMFRQTAERLGLLDRWYSYRDQALEQIARDWLEGHKIPYE